MKQDRIVIITGASGGMGTLFVERFLANSDTVVATDTSKEALTKLVTRNSMSGAERDLSPARATA